MTKHLKRIARALEALNDTLRTPTVTIQGNVGLNRRYPDAALAQYAAPAKGEQIASAAKPIDPDDVQVGDLVRVVMDNGDEATFTVAGVRASWFEARDHSYSWPNIRALYLLDREVPE